MHCKSPLTSPKCSLYAKCFKTHMPICDTLGPFPDEILTSSIDRVMYLVGGKRLQNYFNSKHSPKENVESCCCSAEKRVKRKAHCNCSSDECSVKDSPTYCVIKKPKYQNCEEKSISFRDSEKSTSFGDSPFRQYSSTPQKSIKESTVRQESSKIGVPLRALRRSFSLCSLACRKLKEKLTTTASFAPISPRSCDSSEWLWTKVEYYADGCQVYEVFKNSSAATHPTKFDTCRAAKIIFVVLPTGIIMPFETLPRH